LKKFKKIKKGDIKMSNAYNEQIIEAEISQIGPRGIPGEAATIEVARTITVAPTQPAVVRNLGTSSNAQLEFFIPMGIQGPQGKQGPQGIEGPQGAAGNGIDEISKLSTSGLVDTYRISFTNNTHYDYTVTNGDYISSIEKTGTSGLVDTYTITLTSGDTHTFTVTNGAEGAKGETGEVGNGIINILKMSTQGLVDNYRINFTNGTFFDYSVTNAKSITGIEKTGTSGLIDTYKISFNDNTSFSFPVSNGNGVSGVTLLSWEGLDKTYRMSFTNGSHFDYVVSNGAAGQVEWGGVAGVLSNQTDLQNALNNKAGTDMSNLSEEGITFINNSKALETGGVSSNTDIYADIYKYAHSTFDKSKFTVVGSPNITDDGVASGLSSSNYIQQNTPISSASSVIIKGKGIYKDSSHEQIPFRLYNTTVTEVVTNFRFGISNKTLYLHANKNGVDMLLGNINLSSLISDGDTFEWEFTVGTNAQKFKYKINNVEYQQNFTADLSGYDIAASYLNIGNYGNNNLAWEGSLDIKQFSVTVDNIPVFSGNKTGIDTIKPDDYTVVGTPTITDDGIASGFLYSPETCLKSNIDFSNINSFVIEGRYYNTTGSGLNQAVFELYDTINNITKMRFGVQTNGTTSTFYYPNSDTTVINNQSFKTITLNTWNDFKIVYDGTNVSIYINDMTTSVFSVAVTKSLFQHPMQLWIGLGSNQQAWNGSIDLNAFKIYVEGNLVYQPCLKIPYTLSKTGSKVVDVYARPRVQDMYEQFGYAPYYTIDEANENFTLPMGEVYGMIQKVNDYYKTNVTSMIMPDYANGISVTANTDYTVPSDGWVNVMSNNNAGHLYINGVDLGYVNLNASNNDASYAIYPVSKGDIVKLTAGTITFYPCKGV
jgi:hypothetical protein